METNISEDHQDVEEGGSISNPVKDRGLGTVVRAILGWLIRPPWITFFHRLFAPIKRRPQHDSEDLRIRELEAARARDLERLRQLEQEKDDALTRLSRVASAKLRDNNPNIADLGDQYRPTKLAEMFSELYDNEWTNAFTVMEGQFSDRQIIHVLLDIVMESYEFSGLKIEENWQYATRWFLDEDIPGNQQTCKAIKDARKINILKLWPEIADEFKNKIKGVCEDPAMAQVLANKEMIRYMESCMKLCLLMHATDPPVVLECPDWTGGRDGADKHKAVPTETHVKTEVGPENKDIRNVENGTSARVEITENGKMEFCHSVEKSVQIEPKTVDNVDITRVCFNRDCFKEYTGRGKYVEYIVWPVMLLYKNGPVLNKGVAQGTDELSRNDTAWCWYSRSQ